MNTTNNAVVRRLQRLEDRRTELAGPVDGLSGSLMEFGAELAAMDDAGLLAAGAELGINLETMREMARDYAPPIWRR